MEKNSCKISVIVPVYNSEMYLEKCIRSIVNQRQFVDYELILVDDGSTDNSINICNKFKKEYENVLVLQKENGGPNSAILFSMSHVKGQYVLFVDSDDWIEEDTLCSMYKVIIDYNPDLVVGKMCRDENTDYPDEWKNYTGLFDKSDIITRVYPFLFCGRTSPQGCITNSRCCKLFKKDQFEESLRSVDSSTLNGEDAIVVKPYVLVCNSVYFLDKILYHYRTNNNSATHSFRNDYYQEQKRVLRYLKNKSDELSDYDFSEQFLELSLLYALAGIDNLKSSLIYKCSVDVKDEIKIIVCDEDICRTIKCIEPGIIRRIQTNLIRKKNWRIMFFLVCILAHRENSKKQNKGYLNEY